MDFPIPLPPEILAKAAELGLRPEDVEEQFTRSGGPGGQNVNKRSTAVELHHLPSGMRVRMQKHREQGANRISAYKLLILKLEERAKGEESALAQERFKIRARKKRRSKRAKEKMLEEKKRRGEIKGSRRLPPPE